MREMLVSRSAPAICCGVGQSCYHLLRKTTCVQMRKTTCVHASRRSYPNVPLPKSTQGAACVRLFVWWGEQGGAGPAHPPRGERMSGRYHVGVEGGGLRGARPSAVAMRVRERTHTLQRSLTQALTHTSALTHKRCNAFSCKRCNACV